MMRPLYDYVLDTIQDEECLIWDTAFTNPNKWLNNHCEDIETWDDECWYGTWISQITGKMRETYKEIT